MLQRGLPVIDPEAQILCSEVWPLRHPHFQRPQRTVPGVVQMIDNANVEPVGRACGGTNLRLTVYKIKAGTERRYTTGCQKRPGAKSSGTKKAKACFPVQDGLILPGRAVRVKSYRKRGACGLRLANRPARRAHRSPRHRSAVKVAHERKCITGIKSGNSIWRMNGERKWKHISRPSG